MSEVTNKPILTGSLALAVNVGDQVDIKTGVTAIDQKMEI